MKIVIKLFFFGATFALISLVAKATGVEFRYAVTFAIIGVFGAWLQMIAEAS